MSAASISAMANLGAMPMALAGAGMAAPSTPVVSPAATGAATPAQSAPDPTTARAQGHAAVAHVPAHHAVGAAPSAAGAVGGTVFALLFVVGLILALAWLAKRMPGLAKSNNASLKLVASLPLGPRERVVVVDVGGTQLLLGVGAGGTRALHTLDAPLPVVEREKTAMPPFAQLLAQHFGKKP